MAVQFPMYEAFKTWLGQRRAAERGEVVVADRLSTVDLIVASSSSKVIGPAPPLLQGSKALRLHLPAYQHALCAAVATVIFTATPPCSA